MMKYSMVQWFKTKNSCEDEIPGLITNNICRAGQAMAEQEERGLGGAEWIDF